MAGRGLSLKHSALLFAAAILLSLYPMAAASDGVQMKILFPADANKTDVNATEPLSDCRTAFNCFNEVAQLNCKYYPATGPLACLGHPEVAVNCLITAVDAYSGAGWFGFYVNNQLADTGVSCYFPKAGDVLELRYSSNPESEVATPTPAPAATATPAPTIIPVQTATPVPAYYPGILYVTPTAAPTATPANATPGAGKATGDFILFPQAPNVQPLGAFLVGAAFGALIAGAFVALKRR